MLWVGISVQNLPYLVCSCSLVAAEGAEADQAAGPAIDFVVQENGEDGQIRPSNPLAMLCGTRAYSAVESQDVDGQPGLFFVFWDVSVRQVGRYRMKFTLIEACVWCLG